MGAKTPIKTARLLKAAAELKRLMASGNYTGADARQRVEKMRDAGLYDLREELGGDYGPPPASHGYGPDIQWHRLGDAATKGARPVSMSGNAVRKMARDTYRKAIQLPSFDPVAMRQASPWLGTEEGREKLKSFQDIHDTFVFCHWTLGKKDGWRPWGSPRFDAYQGLRQEIVGKIMTTSGVGTGAEFIPDILSGQLVPLYREELVLMAEFTHITMPSKTFSPPLEGVAPFAKLVSESTSDAPPTSATQIPAVTVPTGKVTFTAKNMKVIGAISAESDEDSIFSTIDYTRRGLVRGHGQSQEDALINGDATSSHMDADVTAATDHRKAWNGLRKLTNQSSARHDASNAVAKAVHFRNLYTKMGKFGRKANESTIAIGAVTHAQLLNDPLFQGQDKVGQLASQITGQVGIIDGRPVVMTPYIREDLEATGVYSAASAATQDRTHALCFHRGSFAVGDRRSISVDQATDIWTERILLLCTWRGDFQRLQAETAGVHHNVTDLYNLAGRTVAIT